MFLVGVFFVGVLSGATAAIAGFGIGSLLTPLLAVQYGTSLAVAVVAIPHAVATSFRAWRLRHAIDGGVVRRFGLLSAAGGLIGALLYTRFSNTALTRILGILLVSTSVATMVDLPSRVRPRGPLIGVLGLVSGLFGGLAGNQGGLRAAAMLPLPLTPVAYVATATATALMVDIVRTPIYLWRAGAEMSAFAGPLSAATVGVVLGTLLGERILLGLSPHRFRVIIAAIVGLLGLWLLLQTL